MSYELRCEGATSVPVVTTDLVADCASAAGSLLYVESESLLPELSLADGGAIASAIIGVLVLGFIFRALRKMIEES